MPVGDTTRLRHMLDAGREAVSFVEGKTRGDLNGNRQLALSLVKCIEIMGEAAANVGIETRQEHNEIPWQGVVAMRNRLIHGYFDIDLDRVWATVTKNVPALLTALEEIIESS